MNLLHMVNLHPMEAVFTLNVSSDFGGSRVQRSPRLQTVYKTSTPNAFFQI